MSIPKKSAYYQTWMTIIYDRSLKIVDIINPQHCMLLQLSEGDLMGKDVSELESITDDANRHQAGIIAKNVRKAYSENRNVYFEYSTTHKDGTITYAVCYAEKGVDDLLYINVIKIDEENIFEAREGFTNYIFDIGMNNISVGVCMRHILDDGTQKYILFNDIAKEFFETNDVLSSPHWNQEEEDAADKKAMQLRDPLKMEKMIRDADDNIKRWVVFTKKKIVSKAGGFYIITTMIDITKRRQNEIMLEQQFSLLDSMYKNLPVGLEIYDKAGRLISVNDKNLEIFGIGNRDDVRGVSIYDDPNTPIWVKNKLKSGEDVEFELEYDFNLSRVSYYPAPQIENKILRIKSSVMHNKNGDLDGYLQICEDVTDKRKTKSIYDLIFKNIPLGIIVYDKNGVLLSLNQQNRNIMGIGSDVDISGINLFDEPHMTPEYCEKLRRGEDVAFELDYKFEAIEGYYKTNNTNTKYLEIEISVIKSDDVIIGYLLTNHDKSVAKKRELLLEQTSIKFASVFNSMTSSVVIYNTDGVIVDCNQQELELFGIEDKEEFIRRGVKLFDNPNIPKATLVDMLNGKEVFEEVWYDFDLVREHNYFKTSRTGKICIQAKGRQMLNSSNELLGYVIEANDITKSKEQEQKLHELHGNLELALNAGHVSTWVFDVQNKYFTTLMGKTLIGNGMSYGDCLNMIHPDDRLSLTKLFDGMISGTIAFGEIILRFYESKIADYRYYESEMKVRIDMDGNVNGIIGTQRDITEKCLKKLELDNARKSMDLVMAASDMLAWDFDIFTKRYRLLYGNRLIKKHSGITEKHEHFMPEDSVAYKKLIDQVISGELDKGTIDTRIMDNDGKYYTFENTIASVRNAEDKIIGLIGSMYEITDRIKHQQDLEEHKIKRELINKACNIIQWDYDIEQKQIIAHSNESIFPDHPFSLHEYLRFVHPEDHAKVNDAFLLANSKHAEIIHLEIKVRSPLSEEYNNIVLDGVAIKDNKGKIIKYSGIRRDASRWVKINEELTTAKNDTQLANQMLNEMIDKIPGAVYMKDVSDDFRYIKANEAFCYATNKKINEIIGKQNIDVFDKNDSLIHDAFDRKLADGEAIVSYDTTFEHDGVKEYQHVIKSMIKLSNNKDVILGVMLNTTRLHVINNELLEAKEKAEQSDKLKSAFLANMSHEIRTPLNAIVGFSELLVDCNNPEEKAQYVNIINNNNDMLLRLIGDILDMSKIESGLIELKYDSFDLAHVFDEVFTSFKQKMINADVKFIGENPYAKCIVYLDKNRLIQVGTNFITNAIKYTPKGHIKMGYSYENGGIRLYVEDTGIGIAKEKQSRVFDRFEKLDSFAQGFGLGLSICKAIADVKHGKIGFTSEEGQGSTFWVWFPTKAVIEEIGEANEVHKDDEEAMAIVENTLEDINLSKLKILVAEDNDSNFKLINIALKECKIMRAVNGQDAVDLARANRYDLILMDINMPIMDGLEATKRIRRFDNNIVIIAVAANSYGSEMKDILDAGCDSFIAKPLKIRELKRTINGVLNR